jgi:thiosulfate/3-mercaptopyruvate sulfurtransferase
MLSFVYQKDKVTALNAIKVNYLIEAKELKLIQTDSSIKIIDFRKKEFYNKEHIEGALQMWRTGIQDTIIIYDDNGLCEASRL